MKQLFYVTLLTLHYATYCLLESSRILYGEKYTINAAIYCVTLWPLLRPMCYIISGCLLDACE